MNVLELFAKIIYNSDELDRGLSESEKKVSNFGSKLKNGLSTAAKVGGAALTVASTAAIALSKQAIDAYADYEQLEGGIETLFGDSAQKVLNDASEAFKTAGMSMNDYMDTSIQSAAALINSLGGDQAKAADLMNMSIVDMADNVNKMGTSMEGVQNAYRGFSRGNFTMLDNLALGFAGTKEGMQELLDKAKEISGIEYDIDSYADIVQAIHVVQEEMGIAGTTAKEAGETIQGATAAMKSAWHNLLTGMGRDNANMDKLIDDLVTSVGTVLKNLLPVAERALGGIGKLIENLAPMIAEKLPTLIDTVLPPLLNAATSLIGGVANALPGILSTLLTMAPGIIDALLQDGFDLILQLVQGMANPDAIMAVMNQIIEIIDSIALWIGEYADVLLGAAVDLIIALAQGLTDPNNISTLVDTAVELLLYLADALINNLPELIKAAPEIVTNLMQALIENAPKLLDAAWELIQSIVKGIAENLPDILQAGVDVVFKIIDGIVQTLGKLVEKGKEIVDSVKDGFQQKVDNAKQWGKDLIANFISGIKEKWENLKSSITNVAGSIKDLLGFSEPKEGPLKNFHTFAPDMMDLFAKGVRDNKQKVLDELGAFAGQISTGLSYGSPSATMNAPQPIIITVQSILDGKVIAETTTRYQNNRAIAMGGV